MLLPQPLQAIQNLGNRAVGDRTGEGDTSDVGDAVGEAVGDPEGGTGARGKVEEELEQPQSTEIVRAAAAKLPSPSPGWNDHKRRNPTNIQHYGWYARVW